MSSETTTSISPEDIVVERELIPVAQPPTRTVTESGMLKALSQDYAVDGPRPKCDGND